MSRPGTRDGDGLHTSVGTGGAAHVKRAGRLLALAASLAVLSVAHQSYVGLAVTVDGQRIAVRRGAVVAEVVEGRSEARPGRMLSAAEHRVLNDTAGLPVTVLMNGAVARASTVVRSGDCILTIPGADVIEPVVEETRTLECVPTAIGAGSVEKVLAAGSTGYAVLKVGSISGEVVATETVVPATPAVVRRVPVPGSNVIALTFDDGPWPGQTEAILQILEQRNVPATFFMLGMRVDRAPDLARAVAAAGHAVGNHTCWHVNLSIVTPEVAAWEIEYTNQTIQAATGIRPAWFRAPGGHLSGPAHGYIGLAGMRSALWTVDPQDWRAGMTPEQLAWSVVGAAHPGAIVLLHDGGGDQATTIAALPMIIDGLRAAGYEFVTLDELPEVRAGW